ncbi:MAG TPA: phospholipase D-like domain-containing protein [Bacteroidia bacterium]|jgi:phosphatidylserine/phosphatidylglycerophosphate/cardiolipin synthase-like enzyme|nr:phospholipase D-like domain-containing protein [Bacteroidia bacterium]
MNKQARPSAMAKSSIPKYSIRISILAWMIMVNFQVLAQNPKIKVYFNRPVNNAVSTGTNAVYLHNTMADTIAAYINRAKYSVDIAQYDYSASSASSSMAVIANACNSAHTRGVVVRWIYDGSQPNSGLPLLNAAINKLASPVVTNYIMHNKFVAIDATSATTTDPYTITGSNDWGVTQTDSCYNNLVIIQDKPLTNAYYLEFNKMWGGTGAAPVSASSKFSTNKTHSAVNVFNVNGTTVEVYFSPKDTAQAHLLKAINSVNNEFFFGIYTFTDNTIANLIKTKYTSGIAGFGMVDSYSQTNTPYTTLSPVMGANIQVFTGATSYVVYHNKTMLIDPLTPSSDPQVFTGSYNWTSAGNATNDENSILIHDANIANQYYQSFCQNFRDLGGAACPAIATAIEDHQPEETLQVFPNPFKDELHIQFKNASTEYTLQLFNAMGQLVLSKREKENTATVLNTSALVEGIYFLSCSNGSETLYRKVIR